MKAKTPSLILLAGLLVRLNSFGADAIQSHQIEKIVIIRHAEKPLAGLGQLTCQGLNRSLQLPNYLISHFPHPNFIFAPNPSVAVNEGHRAGNKSYDYVRPLATIEPTAIRLGMPVNVDIGFNQPTALVDTLLQPKYHNATIYVAWEHYYITRIAKIMLKRFALTDHVPYWSNDDYSTVFVFTVDWHQPKKLRFTILQEPIMTPSKKCPKS